MTTYLQKIDGLTKLKKEIASMHVTVPLAMFCLDALKLNEELCHRTQKLKDRLVQFQIDENRDVNQRYAKVRDSYFTPLPGYCNCSELTVGSS